MFNILDIICPKIPLGVPRYLMGVGKPEDIVECVYRGIDIFDCVIPTRHARNGQLFVDSGVINIKNKKYKYIFLPLDLSCKCYTCLNYNCSFLYYLYKYHELLSFRLNTIHNLYYYQNLMFKIRNSILLNKFDYFMGNFYMNRIK